jgi:protocatechuate 3,4-dioxygenase beta subunit
MSHENHHGGLAHDLEMIRSVLIQRRQVLRWAVGATLLPLVGCGDSGGGANAGTDAAGGSGGAGGGGAGTGGAGGSGGQSCAQIPEETGGPYPGDGSNGPNVLNQTGIVRADLRSSFAGLSGTADGVPLTVSLTLVGARGGCAPLSDLAVYLWHCDQVGRYSLYSAGVTDQNYLRGVQATDGNGRLSFTTIFPGCYSGRWPHIHFEVYANLAAATGNGSKLATSQLALPQAACETVYATSGYAASVTNLQQTSLARDNVFSDGWTTQIPTVTGSVADGFVAQLTVPVPA